jgi:hypothetical protein
VALPMRHMACIHQYQLWLLVEFLHL